MRVSLGAIHIPFPYPTTPQIHPIIHISSNLQLLSDILAARGTRLLDNYYCHTF